MTGPLHPVTGPLRAAAGRAIITLALVTAGALHLTVTGQVFVPLVALLLALGATVAGPRLELKQAAQALLLVATVLLTFGVALIDLPLSHEEGGPKLQYVVIAGAALLTLASRLWMRNPERGDLATWGIGLLVFTSCGRVLSPAYLPLSVAYLSLAWLHTAHSSGVRSHRSGRHVALALALVLGSSVLAGGAAWGLRTAFAKTNAFILAQVAGGEVGFGAGAFRMDSLDGLRDSTEVILRVHGPVAEHLRGQVYAEYEGGVWYPPVAPPTVVSAGPEPTGEVSTIEFVSKEEERLFLPQNSASVAVSPPGLRVDALGIPRPAGEPPTEVRFSTTGAVRLPPAAPGPADLSVSPEVDVAIGPLVDGWISEVDSPRARVEAIQERLEADYTYSLHYERLAGEDPVVQFLLASRLGHCEYFASGMALAARHAGVPARVVTGFRSSETSPFGGHRIVRSRDAHAWVEVYLDGAWERVDPSPRSSLETGSAQSFLSGALDDLKVLWERLGLEALAAALVLLFVGLQVRTLLRGRRSPALPEHEAWVEGPPAWLLPLLDPLAAAGLSRGAAEPIEAFSARLEAAAQGPAGDLLRRYAALRYGGQQDPGALAQEVRTWRLAPRPPAEGP